MTDSDPSQRTLCNQVADLGLPIAAVLTGAGHRFWEYWTALVASYFADSVMSIDSNHRFNRSGSGRLAPD
ncbi:hypothetical protein WQE_26280 [Paraburkholderia hospita]|uniref:Uncharacterized protein n=1 Tax=Paraburkholderia hospita TaxID=169430 RepID=A0ABP2PKM0_9BURK|nr:hypothetical protein [Paraburkholderia hospita]EIM97999.1 hypothetical protein WQE_26280 [Paraburkholderia hospita]